MDLTSTSIQTSVVVAGALLVMVIGLLATLRRGHWLTTLLFASSFLSIAAFQAGTVGLLVASDAASARSWATYLAAASALVSWLWLLLSVVLARSNPWEQLRNAAAYLVPALGACVAAIVLAGNPGIVQAIEGRGGGTILVLGGVGRIYLMYLVVAMIAVLMNLERLVRSSGPTQQQRLRAMSLAILAAVMSELVVVSAGLLYGSIRVSWLSASSMALFAGGVVTAQGLARRRLSDMSIPLARPVIYYSSVSLTLAGAFLLSMAVLSRVFPMLGPEWKRYVSLCFYLLVGGGGLLLTVSPRSSRAVKRFVDRNFYANRYDYRREWEGVTDALAPGARLEDVARQVESLLGEVFEVRRTALYVADEGAVGLRRMLGPAEMPEEIARSNPLVRYLAQAHRPLSFDQIGDDLDLIPVAAQNREAIRALGAAVCAPLLIGGRLVGLVWLSSRRNDEPFSEEDLEFLGAISRQIAASVGFSRQAEQLAEWRQREALDRFAGLVLQDLKSHVSGLTLAAENARRHPGNAEFHSDSLAILERTIAGLRELMLQVASVGRAPEVHTEPCDLEELLQASLSAAGLHAGDNGELRVKVNCRGPAVAEVDRRQMMRVLANLLANACEASSGPGLIELTAEVVPGDGDEAGRLLRFEVRDDGSGMTEEFIRTALFRPFSTTKSDGLGLGLAQCQRIVEAHGGSIRVTSRPGAGARFEVTVPLNAAIGSSS